MRRIGLMIAIVALLAGVGLAAVGCNWTETYRDYPPETLIPPHPGHDHSHD